MNIFRRSICLALAVMTVALSSCGQADSKTLDDSVDPSLTLDSPSDEEAVQNSGGNDAVIGSPSELCCGSAVKDVMGVGVIYEGGRYLYDYTGSL